MSPGTATSGAIASGWPVHKLRGVAWGADLVLVDSNATFYYDYDSRPL